MAKAKLTQTIMIQMKNAVGVVAAIASALSDRGVNMRAICGWSDGDKGNVMLIPDEHEKAVKFLKEKDYSMQEQEVVILEIDNKPGALKGVAEKLTKAGMNLDYVYATGDVSGKNSLLVLSGNDNKGIVKELNK